MAILTGLISKIYQITQGSLPTIVARGEVSSKVMKKVPSK